MDCWINISKSSSLFRCCHGYCCRPAGLGCINCVSQWCLRLHPNTQMKYFVSNAPGKSLTESESRRRFPRGGGDFTRLREQFLLKLNVFSWWYLTSSSEKKRGLALNTSKEALLKLLTGVKSAFLCSQTVWNKTKYLQKFLHLCLEFFTLLHKNHFLEPQNWCYY